MGSCRNGINCPFSHTLKPEDVSPHLPQQGGEDLPVVELEKHLAQQQQHPPKRNTKQAARQNAMPQPYFNDYTHEFSFNQPPADRVPWPPGIQIPEPQVYGVRADEELVASLVEVLRCSVGLATALSSNRARPKEIDPTQPLKVPLPMPGGANWLMQDAFPCPEAV
jgi:hypothetical protein